MDSTEDHTEFEIEVLSNSRAEFFHKGLWEFQFLHTVEKKVKLVQLSSSFVLLNNEIKLVAPGD